MGSVVRVQAPDEFTTAAREAQHRLHTAAPPRPGPRPGCPEGTSRLPPGSPAHSGVLGRREQRGLEKVPKA